MNCLIFSLVKYFHLINFSLCLFFSSTSLALDNNDSSNQWRVMNTADSSSGISTWVKNVPGAEIKAFRGKTIIDRPINEVLMLIDDAENLSSWVFFCQKSQRVGPTEIYMEYKGVWPVKPRFVTITNKAWVTEDSVYMKSQEDSADVESKTNRMVKIETFENLFKITPVNSSRTRVEFTTFVNIGGAIPKWAANYVSKNAPRITVNRMRKILMAVDSPYIDADWHNLSALANQNRKQINRLVSRAKTGLPIGQDLAAE